MSIRHKKAQSTLEYVLLVTAVVVVLITFVLGKDSKFSTALNSTLAAGTNAMNVMSGKIKY